MRKSPLAQTGKERPTDLNFTSSPKLVTSFVFHSSPPKRTTHSLHNSITDSNMTRFLYILVLASIAVAQSCYYPNGNAVTSEQVFACSNSAGSHCCPQNWECLNNGLCFHPSEQTIGRYSCTDKTWKSSLCPKVCTTSNGSNGGNQAVLQCSDGKYCCDGNRSFDCCSDSNSEFFQFDGKVAVMSPMSNAQTQTSTPSNPTTSTTGATSTTTQSSTVSSSTAVTSSSDTLNSASGSHTFATSTRVFDAPSEAAASQRKSSNKTNSAMIVGLTVGSICGVLLLLGIHILCRCHRKRRIRKARETSRLPYNVKAYDDFESRRSSRLSWLTGLNQRKAKNNIPTPEETIKEEEDLANSVAELPADDIGTVVPGRIELPDQSSQITSRNDPNSHPYLLRQNFPLQLQPGVYKPQPNSPISQFSGSHISSRAVSQISPITDGFQIGQMSQAPRPVSYPLQYPRYYASLSNQTTLIDHSDQSSRYSQVIEAQPMYGPAELPATPVAPEHPSHPTHIHS